MQMEKITTFFPLYYILDFLGPADMSYPSPMSGRRTRVTGVEDATFPRTQRLDRATIEEMRLLHSPRAAYCQRYEGGPPATPRCTEWMGHAWLWLLGGGLGSDKQKRREEQHPPCHIMPPCVNHAAHRPCPSGRGRHPTWPVDTPQGNFRATACAARRPLYLPRRRF
jgi:hypothetical protein